MAGASLFALIDDIATLLDDIAVMTKTAATKTAGVIGDDLALNAKQVTGLTADREIPVVWAVAKGSAVNKAILIPSALAISAFAPVLITPLLMLGGVYLCYEGVEKIVHQHQYKKHAHDLTKAAIKKPEVKTPEDLTKLEKEKVKGAIRTDFILSAEIIVLTLGTVAAAPLVSQLGVMLTVGAAMTVGVYGLVAGIVKLDDLGLHLSQKPGNVKPFIGKALLAGAPKLLKFLSVAGTVAMFTVGGEILVHGIPVLHHAIEGVSHAAKAVPFAGTAISITLNAIAGVAAGALALPIASYIVTPVANGIGKLFQAAKRGLGFTSAKKDNGAQPAPAPAPQTPAVQTTDTLKKDETAPIASNALNTAAQGANPPSTSLPAETKKTETPRPPGP